MACNELLLLLVCYEFQISMGKKWIWWEFRCQRYTNSKKDISTQILVMPIYMYHVYDSVQRRMLRWILIKNVNTTGPLAVIMFFW